MSSHVAYLSNFVGLWIETRTKHHLEFVSFKWTVASVGCVTGWVMHNLAPRLQVVWAGLFRNLHGCGQWKYLKGKTFPRKQLCMCSHMYLLPRNRNKMLPHKAWKRCFWPSYDWCHFEAEWMCLSGCWGGSLQVSGKCLVHERRLDIPWSNSIVLASWASALLAVAIHSQTVTCVHWVHSTTCKLWFR